MNKQKVLKFLEKLGFDKYEAEIFFSLSSSGVSSVLDISRDTKIDRSKVYRRLGAMSEGGVVEEVVDKSGSKYKTVGVDKLERLLEKRVENVEQMQKMFPQIQSFLAGIDVKSDPQTKVLFYRGKEGIKQMVWNILSTRKEALGYTYRDLTEITGVKFMKKWIAEFVKRDLVFKDLFNRDYKEKYKTNTHLNYPENFIEKCISRKALKINHQLDIYNDVVSFYNWHKGEVFGVEIYNKKVANLQKQLFELVWEGQ